MARLDSVAAVKRALDRLPEDTRRMLVAELITEDQARRIVAGAEAEGMRQALPAFVLCGQAADLVAWEEGWQATAYRESVRASSLSEAQADEVLAVAHHVMCSEVYRLQSLNILEREIVAATELTEPASVAYVESHVHSVCHVGNASADMVARAISEGLALWLAFED